MLNYDLSGVSGQRDTVCKAAIEGDKDDYHKYILRPFTKPESYIMLKNVTSGAAGSNRLDVL